MKSLRTMSTDSGSKTMFHALGVSMAKQTGGELKSMLQANEMKEFIEGFSSSMTDTMSEEDQNKLLADHGEGLSVEMTARMRANQEKASKAQKEFMDKYLLANPRAQQTQSGLIFNHIIVGTGKQPAPDSKVTCHYKGSLVDGTVFDDSNARGQPLDIGLNQVIKGWQEGMLMMNEGGKAELIIPSDLGYGPRGSPPVIPGDALLKFEVELIKST